jgi:manganese transport protein
MKNRFFYYCEEALSGQKKMLRSLWLFLGPAFIASVAYVDPGNFASNIQSGAQHGYLLVWVVICANITGVFIQLLSAKLGVATERNLAELCRDHYSKWVRYCLWIISEIIAMATDIAEFIGAALGFHLLFAIPLFPAALLTGFISFLLLGLQKRGFRPLEIVITLLVAIIVFAFGMQVFFVKPNISDIASGFIPRFEGKSSVLLACAILGATVMPHVIFLHSALTQKRVIGDTHEKKRGSITFKLPMSPLPWGLPVSLMYRC